MGVPIIWRVVVWREKKWYIVLEPLTGVVSQGRTKEEALENIREALKLYLEEEEAPAKAEDMSLEEVRLE